MASRTFELGLVLAGAISAGAYSAGVLDFLFEALDAYEKEKVKPDWKGPTHDVRVPIMAGASAGGMTASICALHASRKLAHVWPGQPEPDPKENRLYSSWVTRISLDALLETTDLENGRDQDGLKSLLCCDILDDIVAEAFDLTETKSDRKWVGLDDSKILRVLVTLTNLRGVPYSFPLFGSNSDETFGMLNHADFFDYAVGSNPPPQGDAYCLDVDDFTAHGWETYKATALATGAFPIGLCPRKVTRPTSAIYKTQGKVGFDDPATGEFSPMHPDAAFTEEAPYEFISVDGGVIDNAPLELARRFLAGTNTANSSAGAAAQSAILLVAPFPNFAEAPAPDGHDQLLSMLGKLSNLLIDQARFKPDELARAADERVFSRFMISPTRTGNGSAEARRYPIACGVLGGFGGFLHETFRRHDYILGRRNAQAFLRWNFSLPETNALFNDADIDTDRWYVRDVPSGDASTAPGADGHFPPKQYTTTRFGGPTKPGFPIIPLVDRLLTPIEHLADDMPRPDKIDPDALRALVKARAEKVVATLVDVDLAKETAAMIALERIALREGARLFGTQIVTEKAMTALLQAADEVAKAFQA